MTFRSALFALPLLAAAGCGGCGDLVGFGAPFSHEIEGTLRVSFGPVAPDCTGAGTRTSESGTITYAHGLRPDGTCGLAAQWEGTLLDTAEAKEQVAVAMEEQGLDPENVKITFTKVTFDVTGTAIRDASGNDVTPPSIPSYGGALDIEGEDDLIVVEHAEGGDPAQPTVTVKESEALVEALNGAWADGAAIPGTGDASAVVDLAAAAAFAETDEPALELDYVARVEATIGL